MKIKPKVLVFGTFDSIHPGHEFFINESTKLGNLIIAVSSDKSALTRGKTPTHTERTRITNLKKVFKNVTVKRGDEEINSWDIIKKEMPDIIALGYDQRELKKELQKVQKQFRFKIKTIKSHMPKKFHSSIIKSNTFIIPNS